MNVALPPELERVVAEKVDAGEYESPSALVHAALALLIQRDAENAARVSALREKLAEGLVAADAGDFVDADLGDILQRARQRHAR